MNKKGFTLVEVIAVIFVLGLIVGLSLPAIDMIMSKSENKAEEAQESEFISLAQLYASSNKSSIDKLADETCYFMSLGDMLEIDLLYKLPKLLNKEYTSTNGVEICKNSEGIEYTYKDSSSYETIFNMPTVEVVYDDLVIPSDGNDGGSVKCTSCDTIYNNNVKDENVSVPDVNADGIGNIIPVIYDETCDEGNGCWRKADTSKNWYDYNNGNWANAIKINEIGSYCLKAGNPCFDQITKHNESYYLTAPANTPISFDDIDKFYVWIPRYDYKIENTYGVGGTRENPGEITIQFNSNLNDTKTGDAKTTFYTHPAFTKEIVKSETDITNHTISGFWVQKFEGEYSIFDTYSIVNISSSNGWQPVKGKDFSSNLNENMITNFEWAAIAYLSQSKYGIMSGNNSVCNKKISSTYDGDGVSIPGIVKGITNDSYTYDGKKVNFKHMFKPSDIRESTNTTKQEAYCGSTSGTIYGVYNMVGGMGEYVFLTVSLGNNPPFSTTRYPSWDYIGIQGATSCEDKNIVPDGVNSPRFIYSVYNNYKAIEYKRTSTKTDKYVPKENLKLGDGLLETSGWYNNDEYSMDLICKDNKGTVANTYMFIVRGGAISDSEENYNIFTYYISHGVYSQVTRYTYANTGG